MRHWRKKKLIQQSNEQLIDNYVPATLPIPGIGLERENVGLGFDNWITSEYSLNDPEYIQHKYEELEKKLSAVIKTADSYFNGKEYDVYVDAQLKKEKANLVAETAAHEHQIVRIRAAKETRKKFLTSRIAELEAEASKLNTTINGLEEELAGAKPQWELRIKGHKVNLGIVATVIATIVDTVSNKVYYGSLLNASPAGLVMSLIGSALCSDATMCLLGTYISRKDEHFTSKFQYRVICTALFAFYLASVAVSFMTRFGEMATIFASRAADGTLIEATNYTAAHYGISLVMAIFPAVTGVLSYALSLDTNGRKLSRLDEARKTINRVYARLAIFKDELCLLENSKDPAIRDAAMRNAAVMELDALDVGLKIHLRKLLAEQEQDASFTEAMSASGQEVVTERALPPSTSTRHSVSIPESDLPKAG